MGRRSYEARNIKRTMYVLINGKMLVLNYSNANTSDNSVSCVICGHLISGIVGMNPIEGMYVYVLYLLYRVHAGVCVSVCDIETSIMKKEITHTSSVTFIHYN